MNGPNKINPFSLLGKISQYRNVTNDISLKSNQFLIGKNVDQEINQSFDTNHQSSVISIFNQIC